jgi:hypothetical protein
MSNNQDLKNIDNSLDVNNILNLNGLDLSNLNVNELDLRNVNINEILDQLEEQLVLGSNDNINDISELDFGNNFDLELNNFDLNQFNELFDSHFSVQSIVQLLESLDLRNIFESSINDNINLDAFASEFNNQFQSEWQANEILAMVESISGNQNLQQLEDLAQLGGLSITEVETQIEEISI